MPTKPHKEYSELVELLIRRGMIIEDSSYVTRKLLQVGYYRLSGFWYISRKSNEDGTLSDQFLPNTNFNEIYRLYIFDKKLRLLLLDIIERLEVHIRSIIAHELGKIDPLAYQNPTLINQKFLHFQWRKSKAYAYAKWLDSLANKIDRNKDDCIEWHRKEDKDLPFWVAIEAWDFGTLSKYYSLLNGKNQRKIAKKFNIDENTLKNWLNEINILRNLCAHHARVWNRAFTDISIPDFNSEKLSKFKIANHYFSNLNLDNKAKSRIFGRIAALLYLISQTSKNYKWLDHFSSLITEDFPNVPNAKLTSMGIVSDPKKTLLQLKQLVQN
ncbi:Abi family protein [Gallibacterium anatis]|uniref:Abortive phage infection protein n=1 Tax=Gallibacterium anatis TaxID=750 RepID=A0A0A2XF17_9PAST|nr:Abi family protein [Gallibacterium anatis]KGQ30733.1 abortive phage infection protein [Gallibacterium anatis]